MNEMNRDDWNGVLGARWLTHHDWLERSFTGFGHAAMKAADLQPGETVLDVGCGTGGTTVELLRRVQPGGAVVGVDVSEALLQRARERAQARGASVDFQLGDAGRHPFAPSTFDVLFSRFGVMFFDDTERAFAHLRAAIKPGGRLAFVCWRTASENEWFKVPFAGVREVLPEQPLPDPRAPGPFAFGDRNRIESILRSGFRDISVTPFDAALYVADDIDEALDQTMRVGPFLRMLAEHPEDVRQRGLASIRAALAARATAQGVSLGGAAWIVTARAR